MRKIKYSKIYYFVIIGIVLLSLLPLMWISLYNCPSADDFNYSVRTYTAWKESHSIGQLLGAALDTSVHFWKTWQGLYSSAFLLSLQPAIFSGEAYAVTGIIMMILIGGSTIFFSCYIMKTIFKRSVLESVSIGAVMTFLMLQYMPSVVEGLYWFNGAINYGFFFALLLIFLCIMIELQRTNSDRKEFVLVILGVIVGFILEGGNHVTALMGVVSTAVTTIICFKKNKRKTIKNLLILITVSAGLMLNLSSPGTVERAIALGGKTLGKVNVFWAIFRAMWESVRNIGDWFGFKEVVILILVMPILIQLTDHIRKKYEFSFSYPLLVIVLSVAWLSMMYCPPFYALGGCGADRLINIVYYSYVILLFIDITYVIGWVQNYITVESMKNINLSNRKYLLTIVILAFALFLSSVMKTWSFEAVQEIFSGQPQKYAKEYEIRDELLLNSEGEDVTVSRFTEKPQMLFFDDITADCDDWRNTGVSKYYGLKSISVE